MWFRHNSILLLFLAIVLTQCSGGLVSPNSISPNRHSNIVVFQDTFYYQNILDLNASPTSSSSDSVYLLNPISLHILNFIINKIPMILTRTLLLCCIYRLIWRVWHSFLFALIEKGLEINRAQNYWWKSSTCNYVWNCFAHVRKYYVRTHYI